MSNEVCKGGLHAYGARDGINSIISLIHKNPPEEDAESLVRHRNRATPLDKNPKRC